MKKLGTLLGLTALAALVPVRFHKDDETGKKSFQSLLWKLDIGPDENNEGLEIGLGLTEGVVTGAVLHAVTAKKEAHLFTDDPAEALFTEALTDAPADIPEV